MLIFILRLLYRLSPYLRHYFFIPSILKGRYASHTRVYLNYVQHTFVYRRYDPNNWGILSQLGHTEYAINICGIHEYDSCIYLWEWEEWKNNVLYVDRLLCAGPKTLRLSLLIYLYPPERKNGQWRIIIMHGWQHISFIPSRHGLDFHRPQSQITIDRPDFHPQRSQKCLLTVC